MLPDPRQKQSDYFISGIRFDAPCLAAGLYVVATPIGNLGDISLRALETLAGADLVLCEDTRQSARLLDHYGIGTRRMSLHEHNERDRIPQVIAMLEKGAAIALISDAGTPLLSDPGFPLVRAVRQAGLDVFALPGPSALLGALSTAGLPTDRFSFIGFVPARHQARLKALQAVATRPETLVFYETARRLSSCLAAMAETFGPERDGAVALELTKRHERVLTGTLGDLTETVQNRPQKGEAVILVGGSPPRQVSEEVWRRELRKALEDRSVRNAVDEIARRYDLRRKKVYDAALQLRS